MGKSQLFVIKIECKLCKFYLEIKSTEENVTNASNNLIKYHSECSPNCKATKDNISINSVRVNTIAENLIKLRLEETVKLLKKSNFKNFIVNDNIRDIIKIKLINYILYEERLKKINKYPISGLILAGIPEIEILYSTIDDILSSDTEYEKTFNVIIMSSRDFISPTIGESGNKIESIFKTIRNLNKETCKETLLIINEIDKLIPNRDSHTILANERTSSLLSEFGGLYDDHTIFIIGITNKLDKIDSIALAPGRFGTPITVDKPLDKSLDKPLDKHFTGDC